MVHAHHVRPVLSGARLLIWGPCRAGRGAQHSLQVWLELMAGRAVLEAGAGASHGPCAWPPPLLGPTKLCPHYIPCSKGHNSGKCRWRRGGGAGTGLQPPSHRPPARKLASPAVGALWAPVQGLWLTGCGAAGPWLLVLSSLSTLSPTPGCRGRS